MKYEQTSSLLLHVSLFTGIIHLFYKMEIQSVCDQKSLLFAFTNIISEV